MRRGGVLLTLWMVIAGTAITIGTWALSLVGGEISDQTIAPLSDSQIARNLRADRSGDDAVVGNAVTPTPSFLDVGRPGPPRAFSTPGGTINARCAEGKISVVSWSPAAGYRYGDHSTTGPVPILDLSFEPDEQASQPEIKVQLWCDKNLPQISWTGEEHHGTPTSNPPARPAPQATDDHGGTAGGHGADDGPTDDHNRRGAGSGGGGSDD